MQRIVKYSDVQNISLTSDKDLIEQFDILNAFYIRYYLQRLYISKFGSVFWFIL